MQENTPKRKMVMECSATSKSADKMFEALSSSQRNEIFILAAYLALQKQ